MTKAIVTWFCIVVAIAAGAAGCSAQDRPTLVLHRHAYFASDIEEQNWGLDVAVWNDGRVVRRKDPLTKTYVQGVLGREQMRELDALVERTGIPNAKPAQPILDAGGYSVEYWRGWHGIQFWQLDDEPKSDSPPGILRRWLFAVPLANEGPSDQDPVVPAEWRVTP